MRSSKPVNWPDQFYGLADIRKRWLQEEASKVLAVYDYIERNQPRYVSALRQLVRQPSVTSDLEACHACSRLLADIMQAAGCTPSAHLPASGVAPILYHEARSALSKRTLLGYGHYDVKPAEPLEAWRFGPWDAEVADGVVFGRGVVDNKSGCLAFVFAIEAFKAVAGEPPVNVKLVFEGEEETGSEHLETWVLSNRELFEGIDGLHCLDGTVEGSENLPRMNLHGKGMIYVELIAKGPSGDVHSGKANLVQNPAWRLIGALASIKDVDTDRILIPGWYDDLRPLDTAETSYLHERFTAFDEGKLRDQLGTQGREFPGGRQGLDLLTAYHREPTANINGLYSGFTQPGKMQTIVPSEARAKLDFRCPPDLDAKALASRLRQHLDSGGYEDIEMEILFAGGYPWLTLPTEPIAQACTAASLEVFGEPPSYVGPTAPEGVFAHHFGIPPILTGFGSPDANIHAPNENLSVDQFIKGIKYAAAIMHYFAELGE